MHLSLLPKGSILYIRLVNQTRIKLTFFQSVLRQTFFIKLVISIWYELYKWTIFWNPRIWWSTPFVKNMWPKHLIQTHGQGSWLNGQLQGYNHKTASLSYALCIVLHITMLANWSKNRDKSNRLWIRIAPEDGLDHFLFHFFLMGREALAFIVKCFII